MQAHIGTLEHTQALNTYLIKYAVAERREREKEGRRERRRERAERRAQTGARVGEGRRRRGREFIVDISMGNHNSRASASESSVPLIRGTYRDGISSSPLPHKSPMH